jgi:hypothetical protein
LSPREALDLLYRLKRELNENDGAGIDNENRHE